MTGGWFEKNNWNKISVGELHFHIEGQFPPSPPVIVPETSSAPPSLPSLQQSPSERAPAAANVNQHESEMRRYISNSFSLDILAFKISR